ncbi:nucleoid-associated protein [Vreelandella andesensis]|uniref:Nucleoid-associated protein n=1 Tax=Vreelandella andesensis TaxID=447567 RepID=A0A433KSZ0_9GAMM|nr:nucleoid-associated protein [Halomonas andesensis]RUR32755.1 nucleoid-associated protein [Halomonas andesensis]
MSILNESEILELTIERMIFHVVDPESDNPVFLAEVSPPKCAEFFIERIKETLRGAQYLFLPGAGVPSLLRRALPGSSNVDEFVKVSHELSERFKEKVKQDKRLASGVLMFFLVKTTNNERLVAIVKYEHQQVVSYSYALDKKGDVVLDDEGNPVPDLETLIETFTQDRKAMQKSAVVRFSNINDVNQEVERDRVVVVDHSSRKYRDATQHFSNFLDIRRLLEPKELTKRLEEATVKTIKAHIDEVPAEVAKAPKRFVRETFSRLDGFDFEKPEEFIGSIIHGVSSGSPILKTFEKNTKKHGISTEAFEFSGAVPPPAEYRRIVTNEGVSILFSSSHEADGKVKKHPEENGGFTITVKSTGLYRDDELEKMPRIPD